MTKKDYLNHDEYSMYLMLPGPVEIHPLVQMAMNRPIYGHRTNEFRTLITRSMEKLKPFFGTNKNEVYILTGSGTVGLVAGLSNILRKGDKVISIVNGKFSDRQAKIAKRLGANVIPITADYGDAVTPEELEKIIEENTDAIALTFCHNETSTGVLAPAREYAGIASKHGILTIADGITSIGGDEFKMDEWGINVAVSGSQKCFGLPPGLAFISLDEKAWKRVEEVHDETTDFYVDMIAMRDGMAKKRDTPFTPAISLIYGLDKQLDLMLEEGVENRIYRHRLMGKAFRAAFKAMNLNLFVKNEKYYSNTVTAVEYPSGMADDEFRKRLRYYGIAVAPGQGSLKGKIFRVAHMNWTGPREVLMTISTMELVLKELGHEIELGKGVAAAQKVLLE